MVEVEELEEVRWTGIGWDELYHLLWWSSVCLCNRRISLLVSPLRPHIRTRIPPLLTLVALFIHSTLRLVPPLHHTTTTTRSFLRYRSILFPSAMGVEVDGTVTASVTQTCVRTGETFDVDVEFPLFAIARPVTSVSIRAEDVGHENNNNNNNEDHDNDLDILNMDPKLAAYYRQEQIKPS